MRLPRFLRRAKRSPAALVAASKASWSLDDVLYWLSPVDAVDVRMAVAGTLVLGATSSGKTSAVGKTIARGYLSAGFGGIVFTVKPGEREFWEGLCARLGRSDDLVIFGAEDTNQRFDFLSYEATRPGRGAGLTENLVNCLSEVSEIVDRGASGSTAHSAGGENGQFFKLTTQSLMRNAIDLCLIATGEVSVPILQEIILGAPTSVEQIRSPEWRAHSAFYQLCSQADRREKTQRQEHDFQVVLNYFGTEFVQLHEKTRSIIVTTFCAMADLLGRGLLHSLFSCGTTITPEVAQDGKIILLDLPLKTFSLTGLIAQTIWRNSFQRSIERRDVRTSPRPVFMWLDEAAHFVGKDSMLFQTTARSSLCATVMIAQNIGAFRSAFGDGDRGHGESAALLGNLNLKLLCANGDPDTNMWAADLVGKHRKMFFNASNSYRASDPFGTLMGMGSEQGSAGISEQMDHELSPQTFLRLRTGGPRNDLEVDAVAIRSGGVFEQTGTVWMPVTFSQRP